MSQLTKTEVFMKLVLAADDESMKQELIDAQYIDQLDKYVLATEDAEFGEFIEVAAEAIDVDYVGTANAVSVIGSPHDGVRVYPVTVPVVVAKDGSVWMDAELFEEHFC